MRVIRNEIKAATISVTVPVDEFNKRNFGWTRIEIARKIMQEVVGLEIDEPYAMQVIPHGNKTTIRLMGMPK